MVQYTEAAAWKCSVKKVFLKNLQKFEGKKTPMLESLFHKVTGPEACYFIKNRLQYSCFPVNFIKVLRTRFFTEQLQWLLLNILNYMIWYQIQTAYPLSRRITPTLYEFS